MSDSATDSIVDLPATELRLLLRYGQLSATEVATAFCDRIEAVDGQVRAFTRYSREHVMAQAQSVEAGRRGGRLAGVPVALKDNLCDSGEPCTCASRMLEDFRPPYDAHVVRRLRREGAVILGRLNMDEFAMGSSTENSHYSPTRNPWDTGRVPGGSSGGSAAAVAASMAPLTLGSDTGGSIRQPAALCGVVGLKPTYGRVSRWGLVAFASSLDQIGPFGRTVGDAALLLGTIAGPDAKDSTCAADAAPDYLAGLDRPLQGLRIGVVSGQMGQGLDEEVRGAVDAALDVYRDHGAEVVGVDLPHARYAIATYYLVATAEASSNLARYDGVHYGHRAAEYSDLIDMYCKTRGEGFGAEVKRRIMLGTFALSAGYRDAYYVKALQVRRLIAGDYEKAFTRCDVIAGPATPAAAFAFGEKTADPLQMYLSDVYTVSANLAGIPAMSLPCGFTAAGLPVGLQLQARPFGEDVLLRTGALFQKHTDWHTRRPKPVDR